MSITKDNNGKRSSKRIIGIVCIGVGLLMAIGVTIAYLVAIFKGNQIEIEQLRMIFSSIFAAGTALLGVGTFEKKQDGTNK